MSQPVSQTETTLHNITHESGASVSLSCHGGTITSWKTADGIEQLYLSPESAFKTGSAIRGGIPMIFPQFSDHGPFGRHGFARKVDWQFDEAAGAMHLSATSDTLSAWPHPFELSLRPSLTDTTLEVDLTVANPGAEPIEFQAALHTYLRLFDFESAQVSGLEGQSYQDQATRNILTADSSPLTPGEEIDRAYFRTGEFAAHLQDQHHQVSSELEGFTDTVIWNPGPEHGIGDLPADGWRNFFCIEAARIEEPVLLEPGQFWRGIQRLEAKPV